MYTGLSAAFLPALRGAHRAYGYCEAWYAGQPIPVDDGDGGSTTRLPVHVDGQNAVAVDGSTPGVRRNLTATLAPQPGLWAALARPGTEVKAFYVVRYGSGVTETVPQGVFGVDVERLGYGPAGALAVTAPDRWDLIAKARFLTPRSFGGGTVRALITSLLLEALPAGSSVTDVSTSTATVPVQSEDRDRAGFIQKIAKAASLDVFFDRDGNPVIRDAPALNPAGSVWTVDAGGGGVFLDGDRQRDRQKTYNLVVVNGTSNDGTTVPFPTQFVWDNDTTSSTYCGPGAGYGPTPPAVADAGPFGQRPTFYSSPLLLTADQAVAAGQTILNRVRGLAAQLTLTAAPNPALDDGDTITVRLPRRGEVSRPMEFHLLDGFTVPLVPSKNPQTLTTRSTRPDDVQES